MLPSTDKYSTFPTRKQNAFHTLNWYFTPLLHNPCWWMCVYVFLSNPWNQNPSLTLIFLLILLCESFFIRPPCLPASLLLFAFCSCLSHCLHPDQVFPCFLLVSTLSFFPISSTESLIHNLSQSVVIVQEPLRSGNHQYKHNVASH